MTARNWLIALGIIFAAISIGFIGTTADWSAGVNGFIFALFGLALIPFVLPVIGGLLFQKSRAALNTCLVGIVCAFAFMAFLAVYAFYINPDPQGGLILIFGPIYTTIGLIPFGIVALIFFLKSKRRTA